MVEIKDLNKSFNKTNALQKINLRINAGESVAIIGPSGSGKTTLLRMVNRMLAPDSGKVMIEGKEITEKNKLDLRQNIGMAFQNFNLFLHLNVIENLLLAPSQNTKTTRKELIEKTDNLLKEFGIYSKKESYPSDLSGGQSQRVAIARALMMNPKIMLFDEPTSALDPENIKDIIEIINNLSQKMTIITVSHHLKFAEKIAQRIIFMDHGMILCDQPTQEFLKKPSSQRARLFIKNLESSN